MVREQYWLDNTKPEYNIATIVEPRGFFALPKTDAHRANIAAALKGRPKSPEHARKCIENLKRAKITPAGIAKRNAAAKARMVGAELERVTAQFRLPRSTEHKLKIGNASRLRAQNPAYRAAISARMIALWAQRRSA